MSLIKVQNLKKHYPVSGQLVKALDDVSFEVEKGQTVGIVGESGCGKSTLAKQLMALESTTAGNLFFNGVNTKELGNKDRYKFMDWSAYFRSHFG